MLLRFASPLRLVALAVFALPCVLVACTSEVTKTDDGTPSPTTSSSTQPAPTPSTAPTTEPPKKDAGTDASATTGVTLQIRDATYLNRTGSPTSSLFLVRFDLENTSSNDVTSLETMTFDFGGGREVALNQPACQGSFPIAAGTKKRIDVTIVVPTSGEVQPANFSMMCPGRQSFGGGEGTAPPTATFGSPITLTAAGKTTSGTFSAAGSATNGG